MNRSSIKGNKLKFEKIQDTSNILNKKNGKNEIVMIEIQGKDSYILKNLI